MSGDPVRDLRADGTVGYLTTNRDFQAGVVAEAVATLGLGAGARVLDAGTGAGGALPPLARAVGPTGTVLGVDRDERAIELARAYVAEAGVDGRVEVRRAEVTEVVAAATGGFDAIWAGDLVWLGNVADPGEAVAAFAAALGPGGVLGLYYANYYNATYLPAYSDLERAHRAASERAWGIAPRGPQHRDRHLGWLLAAGLEAELHVLPRGGRADDPVVRRYLETTVWPELLASLEQAGPAAVGLDAAAYAELRELVRPGGPRYVVDEPGYHVVQPALLAVGRRPDGSSGGGQASAL